jgi:hypothetical protein
LAVSVSIKALSGCFAFAIPGRYTVRI